MQLIAEGGVGALSMREVARRAGVSHQAPYHHFADRAAILAAVAGEGFRRLAEALESAREPKKSAAAQLITSGRAYVRFAAEHPAYFRVMFRPELVELDAYPEAMAEAARAYAALQSLVDLAIEEELIEAKMAEGTVTLSWAIVHGLASLLLDGPLGRSGDEAAIVDGAFAAYRRLLDGVAGKKPPKKT